MTFPLAVGFYAAHHISMDWGSILLIAMGAQWYTLFNVAARHTLPHEHPERVFQTMIAWARYAGIMDYDSDSRTVFVAHA
jgi:hypothetical protein